MQTRPTDYPRLPELAPRRLDEPAEEYGLRALAFVVTHSVTATVPTDALELATHTYRIAIDNRDLSQIALDRLAEVDRQINATLRTRSRLDATRETPGARQDDEQPAGGLKTRLEPRPNTQPPAPALARADFGF